MISEFNSIIFMKCLIGILILLIFSPIAKANIPDKTAQMILIGEAANQELQGMQGVAEVLRRRKSTRGFCTLNRPNFRKFVLSQPKYVWKQAEKAWKLSEKSNITKGATHFENVKAFGRPKWSKSMKKTVTIKDHTFYREVRS